LEALAAGRPIIGTRVSGTVDVINESIGWLVDPDDSAALALAMSDAATCEATELSRMGHLARETSRIYDIARVAELWIDVYARARRHGEN
jgi:glycosyltransferase involved in cell wall biosynthesis